MTDKEIVERAKKAEKRTGFVELVHSPISKGVNSAFGIGFIEGMVEYRNSLQEEPVSEDLEEAAYKFVMDNFGNSKEPLYKFDQRCFKAGACWQKEQMEANRLKHCDSISEEQYNLETEFVSSFIDQHNRIPTILDAIEYGMSIDKK